MAEILIIDDEDFIRERIKSNLEEKGHHVSEAREGEEGINKIKEKHFDIILLDVNMPKKGGIQTLMEIKKNYSSLKTVIISGKVPTDSDAFFKLIKQYGATDIIFKPFTKEQLYDVINKQLK